MPQAKLYCKIADEYMYLGVGNLIEYNVAKMQLTISLKQGDRLQRGQRLLGERGDFGDGLSLITSHQRGALADALLRILSGTTMRQRGQGGHPAQGSGF